MKSKRKIALIIIAAIIVLSIGGALFGVVLHRGSPEKAVKAFHDSLLPDYNENELKKSVGEDVYSIRFDDKGYFVDRYERARNQILYYYGEDFDSYLSDFRVSDLSDAERSSIKREYSSKYSLTVEDAKRVSFSVTLKSEFGEKSREEALVALKINGKWLVYDYDAYWFAYM
ncbi:MAG: hypothetical protein IKY44_00310 [Clostridia bacterium]|nr:hypothetical protein [Clostridia bacterium]